MISQEDVEEFGIETFDDVQNKKSIEKEESEKPGMIRGALTKAADYGVFGSLFAGEEARRHTSRTAARVGETLSGIPGDILQFGDFATSWLGNQLRTILGKEELTQQEMNEKTDELKDLMKPGTFNLVGKLAQSLPTSENIRENVTRNYTGNWLEPQNKWEEFADNVSSDFATLAIPVKGKIPFARALGSSIFANSGSEIVNAFGGDEKSQAYTKMGLLFASGIFGSGKGGVKKYINGLYDEMEATIPKGAQVNASKLVRRLDAIESALRKGDPAAASKSPVFQKIDAIRNKIKNGMIDVEELVQFNKDTNEAIFGLGNLKRGQNSLYDVRSAIHNTLGEYGSSNKGFLDKWKSANEAYAATETSRMVGNYIRKNISPKEYIYAASALGIEGALAGLPITFGTVVAGGALAATAYTAEVMKRIAQSPSLRRYYTNVVTNSLNQNKASFLRAIKQLDDGLKKDFEQEPYETVEFEE